jgi:hypothetical protein
MSAAKPLSKPMGSTESDVTPTETTDVRKKPLTNEERRARIRAAGERVVRDHANILKALAK